MEERYVKTKRGKIHRQTRTSKRNAWLSAEACNLDQSRVAVVLLPEEPLCKRCMGAK